MTTPPTYGEIDPLASAPRYTSREAVKKRLDIETDDWDLEIDRAIVSAEVALDYHWGRSFPDTGDDPQIDGIPEGVKQTAENVSVAVFRATDAPFGVVNSENYLGEIDAMEIARREVMFSPLAAQYVISWGIA